MVLATPGPLLTPPPSSSPPKTLSLTCVGLAVLLESGWKMQLDGCVDYLSTKLAFVQLKQQTLSRADETLERVKNRRKEEQESAVAAADRNPSSSIGSCASCTC